MDIISLTTIPARIDYIQPCIDSLLRQNMIIYLWIGKNYHRAEGSVNDIPEFLKHPQIRVRRVEDEGSITKLYPALSLYDVDRIITADDDIIYPDDWAENLLKASYSYPGSAICYRGRNFRYQGPERLSYKKTRLLKGGNYEKVDILTGVHGALYRRCFFDDDFFNYRDLTYSKYVDDIWISGYLADKDIDRVCIPKGDIKNYWSPTGKPMHKLDCLTQINWGAPSRKQDFNDEMIRRFRW